MRSKSADSEWLQDCGSAQHGAIREALLSLNNENILKNAVFMRLLRLFKNDLVTK